ncbi:transposase [Catenulispora sp. NL8]|uniref:Transposase n=2 Tax=Catenulispora pinistramenti TaxID=2705254 RepID=A0ABS5KGC3_9ACTN|nr:transposase [Catenulispora pinistramenti]
MNDTTRLLGLAGVEVIGVELDADDNPMLALVTVDEQANCCPGCGVRSENPHGWVRTRPRDLPVAGRRTALTWTKRRWKCQNPGCPRRTFTESLPQIPPRSRLTGRLRASAGVAVADPGRTVLQAARDHEVSWPVVQAAFVEHAAAVLPEVTPEAECLGIDETRRGRAKYRLNEAEDGWEVVADRWHVGFVDLRGGAGLLGQVEGRTAASVSAWIDAQEPGVARRGRVRRDRHVHHLQSRCPCLTAERHAGGGPVPRRAAGQCSAHRGPAPCHRPATWPPGPQGKPRMGTVQSADPLGGADARQPARPDGRGPGEPAAEDRRTDPCGRNCKEDLMDLLSLTHTDPDRTTIADKLFRFYAACAESGLVEMERLATTVETWWPQIEAAIRTGMNNAGSEGTNRVIKTDARAAFGYRNPANQRLRARCTTTRRSRGHLSTRTSGRHGQLR